MDYVAMIQRMLKPKRFEHSLNVAEQAVILAEMYHENTDKAYLAGILHDVCKNMPTEEQLQWVKKSDIILDSGILQQPKVWHGIAGSVFIQDELGVTDEDIINAVRYHTIGRENMSRLEQIVYLADLTSKERNYSDVGKVRKLAQKSLWDGMQYSLMYTVGNLVKTESPICLDTCRAYNQYLQVPETKE